MKRSYRLKKLYAETIDYVSSMKSRGQGSYFLENQNYIEEKLWGKQPESQKCSEDLFLSSGYISMTLKKSTGKTFVDYLNEFRVESRTAPDAAGKQGLHEVAMEVGFSIRPYFSSVFKKIMGTSPAI